MNIKTIAALAATVIASSAWAGHHGADSKCGAGTCGKKEMGAKNEKDAGMKDASCGKKGDAGKKDASCGKKDASCGKKDDAGKKDASCSKK